SGAVGRAMGGSPPNSATTKRATGCGRERDSGLAPCHLPCPGSIQPQAIVTHPLVLHYGPSALRPLPPLAQAHASLMLPVPPTAAQCPLVTSKGNRANDEHSVCGSVLRAFT